MHTRILLPLEILDAAEILKTQPYVAAIEQILVHLPEGYRSLVVGNYKVVYFIINDMVLVVQVFDCRRNPVRLVRSAVRRKQKI